MAANLQNLKPNSARTPEERVALARKAGQASGVARRNYKRFLDAAIEQGEEIVAKAADGTTKNNIDAVIRKLYEQARQGDTASIALLLKIRGEDVQKVELAAAPPTIVGDFGETDDGDVG